MSNDTWNKYCEKLEELRRLEDEARKRRKEASARVEIVDKRLSVSGGPISAAIEDATRGAHKGDA